MNDNDDDDVTECGISLPARRLQIPVHSHTQRYVHMGAC